MRERTGAHEGDTQPLPLPSRVSLARTSRFFLAPMYFLSAYYATLTLGARDFSSAISGFCQVFVMIPRGCFSRATRSFVGRSPTRHERRSHEKKPFAQSAFIYCTGWTLTLSLICQSNRRLQANRPFPSSPGPLYQNEVR